ncbi:VOC family protein [Roseiarcaceae bacterium H3SJ34-1]|uniref:VOC family protein n=1 Tax=Terripilifer ovatus TaxID=3032367 RepID=UPI003AB93F25|nr:VOC family protein [Roseiarcaceae bacterium H3SJ34-1]
MSSALSEATWPGGFHVAQVCIARPTARFDEVIAFYRDGLGLPVLFQFDEGGAKGGMVGLPGSGHHLEFIQPGDAAGLQFDVPNKLHALVLHMPDPAEVEALSERLRARGLSPVTPGNPYWIGRAIVYEDPDGWPIVLATGNGLG